jgi:hypothetical protein
LGTRREKTAFDPPVGRNFIGRLLELELRLGQCAIGGASGRALAGCWDPGDVHPKTVSERLGSSSTAFTMDTNSAVIPSMGRAAADTADQLFGEEGRR